MATCKTNRPRSVAKSKRSSSIESPRRNNTSSINVGFWRALMMVCLLFTTVESFAPPYSSVGVVVVDDCVRKQRQGSARRHLVDTASPLTPPPPLTTMTSIFAASSSTADRAEGEAASNNDEDPNEIIARRIIVEGSVQGGYYRSCVLNEGGRFRKLTGTMTPPDDSDRAEIYVEGSRKQVNGFVRWCRKGNVGLSQITTVTEVLDAEPTGLYDGFYVKTK